MSIYAQYQQLQQNFGAVVNQNNALHGQFSNLQIAYGNMQNNLSNVINHRNQQLGQLGTAYQMQGRALTGAYRTISARNAELNKIKKAQKDAKINQAAASGRSDKASSKSDLTRNRLSAGSGKLRTDRSVGSGGTSSTAKASGGAGVFIPK